MSHGPPTGRAYDAYGEICVLEKMQPLSQRRFSDIIGSLDFYGIINARVISKERYGYTRDISASLGSDVVDRLLRERAQ
jgi:cell division control protein 6